MKLDGAVLGAVRVSRGFSTERDLGCVAQVSEWSIRQFERGSGRPTLSTIHRLARALNVEVDELLSSEI